MKIVKYCLLPILLFLMALFGLGMAAPDGWDVEVSTNIRASPAEIHGYLNDLRRWPEWTSVSSDEEAQFEFTYEGEDLGVGAIAYSKGSGSNVRWEITASDPAKGIWFDEMLSGSSGEVMAKGAIMLEAQGDTTKVTWVDAGSLGTMPFIRLFHYMMQNSLTAAYQRNLEKLKQLVEKPGS
ncbi:MAG: hypothetical protein ACI9F9_001618 [Candidatus Paceibacteria bacterium]|jgi:hypothetical protein